MSLFPALAVSYYSNKKGLKAELGSDRLLGVPLETYIPSEKLAIESGSADENIEIMKAYMCKQRGIRLIKLPMKGTELDYANSLKKPFLKLSTRRVDNPAFCFRGRIIEHYYRSKTLKLVTGMRKKPQNRLGVSVLCKGIFLLSIITVCLKLRKKSL